MLNENKNIGFEHGKMLQNGEPLKSNIILDVKNDFRSEEIQDILGKIPNLIIRWGITIILFFILLVILLSWIIEYPDIISGHIVLTTASPPIRLIAKHDGKLIAIYANDGAVLKPNTPIAEIENPIKRPGIDLLNSFLDSVKKYINNGSAKIPKIDSSFVLGDMQIPYNNLNKIFSDYLNFHSNQYEENKIKNLRNKIEHFKKLIQIQKNQGLIAQQELSNAKIKYEGDKEIYEAGFFSKIEFYKQESNFKQKLLDSESINKNLAENEIHLIDLQQDLSDLEYSHKEKERNFKENILFGISELKNFINSWQENYLIFSPVEGKLIWLNKWNLNQYINGGENMFAIVQENNEFIAFMEVPSQGFGKVKKGQRVKIMLDKFPYFEFGSLDGEILNIGEISKEGFYRVEISLKNGLTTNYQKKVVFTPELGGTAEIMTDNLKLADRIFFQLRKIFDKDKK